jgi:hypothetical protein
LQIESVVAKLNTLQLQKSNNIAVTKKLTTLQLRKTYHTAVRKLAQLWLQKTGHCSYKELITLQLPKKESTLSAVTETNQTAVEINLIALQFKKNYSHCSYKQ